MTALKRLFGEGFRVFFLAAGLWAVIAMLLWAAVQGTAWSLPVAMPPAEWHAHELIFGYGGAALGGFFLTAVPNWTGAAAARHLFIAAVAGLWLIGRLAVWHSAWLPAGLVAIACLSFLPVLGAKIAAQLIRRPKPQNMMFLGLIAIIWAADLHVQLDWMGLGRGDAQAGLRAGLYGLGAMIAVLGGRVTPAFTRNAMIRDSLAAGQGEPPADTLPQSRRPFEIGAIALSILVALGALFAIPDAIEGCLLVAFGVVQGLRMARWRTGFAARQPILWALHLSFGLLALGYLLTGLALAGAGSELAGLHVTAIGGVGGMTLAVMSRAALGHTGRPLIAPRPVAMAYALIPLAAAIRWGAALMPGQYTAAILTAALVWVLAFAFYLAALWPVFWRPRLPRAEVPA